MRIITGSARGIRLETLEGDATRPTAERVKEAIFSMIHFELEGARILDLFAGSGQLGLEALSRGADNALLADASADAVAIIKRNAQKTKLYQNCRVLCTDYKNTIRGCVGREKFDFIFLDPPYAEKMCPSVAKQIFDADILAEGGSIFCETEGEESFDGCGFEVKKRARYGRVHIAVLGYPAEEEA